MNEPRADDPGALVEEVQGKHHPACAVYDHSEDCDLENHSGDQLTCSHDDCLDWPCLTARLADALAAAQTLNQMISAQWTQATTGMTTAYDELKAERDAARTEAVRLREALQEIRIQLDLRLPSEQTGPSWAHVARVPVERLAVIDTVIGAVLGPSEPRHE